MPVKTPSSPRRRALFWAGVGILNALTLVALWITAWRVRQEKLAARLGGEPSETPASETAHLRLLPGAPVRFAHFTLLAAAERTLRILDARGSPCVDFFDLAPGDQRRWQELALAVLGSGTGGWLLEVRLEAGAPCRGSGLYHRLHEGLRIEFSENRALVVERWSPREPLLELYVESPEGARIETFLGPDERTTAGLRLALEPNPTSGWALRVTNGR